MRIAICDDLQTERQKTIEALDSVIRNFSVNEFDDGAELIKSHEVLPYDLIRHIDAKDQWNGYGGSDPQKRYKDTNRIYIDE